MLGRYCFNTVSTTGLDKFISVYIRLYMQLACERGCALWSKVMVRLVWDHKEIKKSLDLGHVVRIYCSTSV